MNPVRESGMYWSLTSCTLLGLPRLPPSFSVLVDMPPMPSSPSTSTFVVAMPHGRLWDLTSQADIQRAMMQLRSAVELVLCGVHLDQWKTGGKGGNKFPLNSLLGKLLQGTVSLYKHHVLSKQPCQVTFSLLLAHVKQWPKGLISPGC